MCNVLAETLIITDLDASQPIYEGRHLHGPQPLPADENLCMLTQQAATVPDKPSPKWS